MIEHNEELPDYPTSLDLMRHAEFVRQQIEMLQQWHSQLQDDAQKELERETELSWTELEFIPRAGTKEALHEAHEEGYI